MADQKVVELSFRKKDQAVTIGTIGLVKIRDEVVLIDPLPLFQRLFAAGDRCGVLPITFKYEMCSYPPALLKYLDVMRSANKASLADSLYSPTIAESPKSSMSLMKVLSFTENRGQRVLSGMTS